MNTNKLLSRFAASATVVAMLAHAAPALAVGYAQNTSLTIGTHTLTVMAGSQYETLTTSTTGFTVKVPEGQVFIVRSPGTSPLALENDALLPACNVLTTRDNQMVINGPRTVAVTVGTVPCSTTGYDTDNTPFLSISVPNGAATYAAGQQLQAFWTTLGGSIGAVRVSYSVDGGQTYTRIADNLVNNGYYSWTIPSMPTTTHGRFRVDAIEQGSIAAVDISDVDFVINGTSPEVPVTPPPAPPAGHPAYDPALETSNAFSIDADRGFPESSLPSGSSTCASGTRIKGASSAAVYYCGRDGKRHAFPNQRIHDSWYSGFAGVVTLSDAQLANVQLGASVTYRPGVRMVKITTDPKVYAVAANGTLRWVPDEWTAKRLYGNDWNKKVDDLSDAFFADYSIGEPVPTE